MIGLLIITHERLGAAYQDLVKHFFPNQNLDHIYIHGVASCDDHSNIIEEVQTMLPEINQGKGVLVFTDIFGATPSNAALKLVQPQQVIVLTGLNAPMLIKAISQAAHHDDVQVFAQIVREAGLNGVMLFDKPI